MAVAHCIRKHWLVFSVALLGILLCGHLVLIEHSGGSLTDCFGSQKTTAPSGLFDCQISRSIDPLHAIGSSLSVVGLFYWCSLVLLLLGQLLLPNSTRLRWFIRLYTIVAALLAVGLVIWQYLAVQKLCPLCLIDAGLAVVAALLSFRLTLASSRVPQAWPAYLGSSLVFTLAGAFAYLAWHQPKGSDFNEAKFYELLSQQIAPRYLDEMAPCGFPEGTTPFAPLPSFFTPEDHIDGSPEAPLQLTVLFDPSCPACGHLNRQLMQIKAAFAEEEMSELLAIRYVPLMLYEATLPATQALWLLRGQPEFLLLKDQLAVEDGSLIDSTDKLRPLLTALGLDADTLIGQIEGGAGRQEIIDTTLATYDAGIESLPRIFINGKPVPQSRRNRSADCLARTLLGEIGDFEVEATQTSPEESAEPESEKSTPHSHSTDGK